MENQEYATPYSENEFHILLRKASQGDQDSLQQVIDCLMPDIQQFARWIGLPKEDAVQAIVVEFIEFLRKSEF